jgi:hypothetical protein
MISEIFQMSTNNKNRQLYAKRVALQLQEYFNPTRMVQVIFL